MLMIAHQVVSGGRGEDRVHVERRGARTLAIVADGAGGSGHGAAAAELTCSFAAKRFRERDAGTAEDWARCLYEIDQALVRTGGQCTAVLVEIAEGRVFGASVGDSAAWMLTGKGTLDLTESQNRKPLLGSDEALPLCFGPTALTGRLLIATDGLFKYAAGDDIARHATEASLAVAVHDLIAGLRFGSGDLHDDVGIILIENAPSPAGDAAPSTQ